MTIPETVPTVRESTPVELATQRYLLDLALQPLDRFDGFTRLEQIGGSALRYQLNYVGYALSMAQYTRTPAFTGYLADAQATMIRKMCDKKVWGYWATERLAGYLRWNPDPIVFGNVMYTGFFAAMIAFQQTLNDDRSFDVDGSLPLVWSPTRRYDYGYTSIAEAIVRNMRASKHTMYPCEPHLIYPMCNTIALVGLRGYDRLHDTDLTGDLVTRTRAAFTDHGYLTRSGRFRFGRGPAGLALPPTLSNDAIMTYWLNGVMPDLAESTWETLRRKRIEGSGSDVRLRTEPIDHLDVGSYRMGDAWAWVNVLCAAREIGDTDTADGLELAITDRFRFETSDSGARKMSGVSTWVSLAYALSRFMVPDGLRGLSAGDLPAAWTTGPILAGADYPDVLVAKAVTDGEGLELVLRPGSDVRRSTLRLARLTPAGRYRVDNPATPAVVTVTADGSGHATLVVDLADRTEVRIRPL